MKPLCQILNSESLRQHTADVFLEVDMKVLDQRQINVGFVNGLLNAFWQSLMNLVGRKHTELVVKHLILQQH